MSVTLTGSAPLQADIEIDCGSDFTMLVNFVDSTTLNPITVSTPQMQIRGRQFTGGPLVIAPTLAAASNVVTVTVPGTATRTLQPQRSFYDLFVVRTDTGAEVKLAFGQVNFVDSVTVLT